MTATELRIVEDRTILEIAWNDGGRARYSASFLRAHSRSADTVRVRIEGHAPLNHDGIKIDDLHVVGAYGINVVFTDGHNRTIFPWAYLRALATS